MVETRQDPEPVAMDCPLYKGLDSSLIPWPELKYSSVRVVELYCKVFNQIDLYNLIITKTCKSCKCPRNSHDVYHEGWVNVYKRLGFPLESDVKESIKGFAWVPPGLTLHKIEEYFQALPPDKVPTLGSVGEKARDKALIEQLPKQDLALTYCSSIDAQHHRSYEDFVCARNEIALDIAYVKDSLQNSTECPTCGVFLEVGDIAVVAPKFGDEVSWHPACFVCCQCKQLLVELAYCVHEDNIYCERHYAERLKPRCAGCDEVCTELFFLN